MGSSSSDAATAHRPGGRASRAERVALWVHRTLDRRGTPLALWVYRRTRGGIARRVKVDVLLLTTRGRRSGKRRSVMLQYFPDGDAMVVTAANGGGPLPGWYHNLIAAPDASVEVDDRVIPVTAHELPAEAEHEWWARIVRLDPSYARYPRVTDRRFPILRLVPRPEIGRSPAGLSDR